MYVIILYIDFTKERIRILGISTIFCLLALGIIDTIKSLPRRVVETK